MLSYTATLVMLAPLSRAQLNYAIWGAGLVLQAALVAVIVRRGVARRFPAFASLVTFYPLRAALMFALSGRIEADDYDMTVHVLGMLELGLEVWVTAEIVVCLIRIAGGWTWGRVLALLVLAAIAFNLTIVLFRVIPADQPADRVQIGMGLLMIELVFVAWRVARSGNLVLIPAGFATFAVCQLASLAGCAYAAAHQGAGAYVAWSYLPGCGYLAVVIFWLAALQRNESPSRQASKSASTPNTLAS